MVFNYDSLIIQVPDERSTINFLQERGLLHSPDVWVWAKDEHQKREQTW